MKKTFTAVVFMALIVALVTVAAAPVPNIHLASTKYVTGKGILFTIHVVDGKIWHSELAAAYLTVNHTDYRLHCFATDPAVRTTVKCEAGGLQWVKKYAGVIHIAGANLAVTIPAKP